MSKEAQDPKQTASPSNSFICVINLNVNGKAFLTPQILISNSKLNKANNVLYCPVYVNRAFVILSSFYLDTFILNEA